MDVHAVLGIGSQAFDLALDRQPGCCVGELNAGYNIFTSGTDKVTHQDLGFTRTGLGQARFDQAAADPRSSIAEVGCTEIIALLVDDERPTIDLIQGEAS